MATVLSVMGEGPRNLFKEHGEATDRLCVWCAESTITRRASTTTPARASSPAISSARPRSAGTSTPLGLPRMPCAPWPGWRRHAASAAPRKVSSRTCGAR
eukprot:1945414-Lingulodinium_polyedra.AAC.1